MSDTINRAFLYGESVFTTMKLLEGQLKDWELHFERLKLGVEFIYGPFKEESDWVRDFKNHLEERLMHLDGNKIIRLTIYLEHGRGLSRNRLLSFKDLKAHINATELDLSRINVASLNLRSAPAPTRPAWWPEFLKAGNYLETILLQKKYLNSGDDDLLFLSKMDTVLESSVANIFIVDQNKLYTPPAGPNVLSGVMRKKILAVANDFFSDTVEEDISLDQLYRSEAVFGSNSVRGLFLISSVDDHEFQYSQEQLKLFDLIRRRIE